MGIISYEIRPSKAAVRLIFLDVLRHLAPISDTRDYQYVGFGALEFVDFDLFHRHLGVTSMVSIEANTTEIERYEWNRPFNGITIAPGRASTVLPTLNWSQLSIVWLDYTSQLTSEVLGDLDTLARVLIPGSILAVTINAQPVRLGQGRRQALERQITAERIPIGVTDIRLGGWGLAEVQYEVMNATLTNAFSERVDAASWRQLLNIYYKDNALMQLIAGVVGAPAIDRTLDQCRFTDVPEVRSGADPVYVRVPMLTNRERAWVEQKLPMGAGDPSIELPGVKSEDLLLYAEIYRRLDATA